MMKPVQIVIGRNTVDGHPLGAAAWGRFQSHIQSLLATRGEYYRTIESVGIDMHQHLEQNATVLGSFMEEDLDILRSLLQELRMQFEQVVILLVVGELEVIA